MTSGGSSCEKAREEPREVTMVFTPYSRMSNKTTFLARIRWAMFAPRV
jgi:hypothetical protein